MSQHDEHRQAFSAQTLALGGTDQTETNPKYTPIVEAAKPSLLTPIDVVKLAATLEQVATETYLLDLNRYTECHGESVDGGCDGCRVPASRHPASRTDTSTDSRRRGRARRWTDRHSVRIERRWTGSSFELVILGRINH